MIASWFFHENIKVHHEKREEREEMVKMKEMDWWIYATLLPDNYVFIPQTLRVHSAAFFLPFNLQLKHF